MCGSREEVKDAAGSSNSIAFLIFTALTSRMPAKRAGCRRTSIANEIRNVKVEDVGSAKIRATSGIFMTQICGYRGTFVIALVLKSA